MLLCPDSFHLQTREMVGKPRVVAEAEVRCGVGALPQDPCPAERRGAASAAVRLLARGSASEAHAGRPAGVSTEPGRRGGGGAAAPCVWSRRSRRSSAAGRAAEQRSRHHGGGRSRSECWSEVPGGLR